MWAMLLVHRSILANKQKSYTIPPPFTFNALKMLFYMLQHNAPSYLTLTYLVYYQSLDSRACFIQNEEAREVINIFITRDIKTMERTISEIVYPTVAIKAGFLNKRTIKNNIPTLILRGI